MKSLIKFPAMMFGLLLLLTGTTQSAKAQYDDVSLQTFYDELSPYGTWINDPEYGYVWRPDVDQGDFRPYYTNGRWVMTEYGNTWVSNYDWGWAPFHYGRWIYNRYNRWVWIPDTTWGPAWVSWRSGGGYYGWAPMGPSISININVGRGYVVPDFCWNFVPQRNIYYNSYPRYYSGRNRVYIQNTIIINNTYVRNNRTYYSGPRVDDIRRATNQNVTVYNVSRVNSRNGGNRIENNTVNIYTPRPSRGNDNANAAPRQVVQGNVTRDRIERDNIATRGDRTNGTAPTNNERIDNRYNGRGRDDNNIPRERPTTLPGTDNRAGNIENRNPDRGNIFDRSRERNENNNGESNNRNVERPVAQPNTERSRPVFPSRSSAPEERTQPQYTPPQRSVERAERPQRTERVQQSSGSNNRGSSETNSGRSNRGESSGRPGRG